MADAIYAIREGYVPVSGGQVWYKIVGSGDSIPLLILHGGPGFPHDYLEPLERLANERPIVFYDQLGCGKSDWPEDPTLWRLERFIEELEQLRQALGLMQVHVFGQSWGSMLAVDYALTQPAGLMSLILASPALSVSRWLQDVTEYRHRLPREVIEILDRHETAGTTEAEEYKTAVLEFYRRHLCRLNPWPDALERAFSSAGYLVYETMWGPSEFFVTGNLRGYERADRLHEITVPTLFTCGEYDEATPDTIAWYQSLLPGADIAVFKESAHMPHLEETERYLQVIRDFLRRTEQRLARNSGVG